MQALITHLAAQDTPSIDEQIVIMGSAARAWAHLVDDELRSRWWPYMHLRATEDGGFEERWTDASGAEQITSGRVVQIVPQRLLRLTWSDDAWTSDTTVVIEFFDAGARSGPTATTVRVRHSGWDRLDGGEDLLDDHRDGWRVHLRNLRRAVEARS